MTDRHRQGTLVGRVAIVTGAGAGVGRATASAVAAAGGAVVVADIRIDAAAETVDAIRRDGGRAVAVEADVSDESAVRSMVAVANEQFGRLDLLHNNAAALGADVYGRDLDIESLDLDVWDRSMAVNARGPLLGIKHAVGPMREAGGGSIVNTVSVAALHGGDDHAAYGVSKAAVVALTRYAASMYGRWGIRCNAIAPGLIMSDTAKAALDERELRQYAAERALPWAAEPEDIAAIVVWLFGDDSRCVTGQTIVADSGLVVRRPRDTMRVWESALTSAAQGAG